MQSGDIFGYLDLEHRTVSLKKQGKTETVYNLDDLFALIKVMMDIELAETERKSKLQED